MIRAATSALSSDVLARATLVVAALEGTKVLADATVDAGESLSVGSNSGNELVIPEKFELAQLTLVSAGPLLHLPPPLFVQTTLWIGHSAFEVQGFVRDLKDEMPGWKPKMRLASERFIVRYATGIAFVGRFQLDAPH